MSNDIVCIFECVLCLYHEQIHVPKSFGLLRFLIFRLAIIVDGVPPRDPFLSRRFFRGGGIIYD